MNEQLISDSRTDALIVHNAPVATKIICCMNADYTDRPRIFALVSRTTMIKQGPVSIKPWI